MTTFADYDTKKQIFGVDTPLVAWLRDHPLLKANPNYGFVRTDIDIAWYNYHSGLLVFVEEKSRCAELKGSQRATLDVISKGMSREFNYTMIDPDYPRPEKNFYMGLYVIRFEKTGPHDGRTWIDDVPVSLEQLQAFFQFKWVPSIKAYRDLLQEIHTCSTVRTLSATSLHIRDSVPSFHPEFSLLRDAFRERERIIALKGVA